MPVISKFVESLSCGSLARPSPERTGGAGLNGTGSHNVIGLSSFWKGAELCEWAELGYDHANVCVHGNVSAVPTSMGKCQRQMSKVINGKYTYDSACHVKPVKEASCHVLVSPLCLQRVAAYFAFLSILIF